MSQTYTHRNGETMPPTVEGWYWFDGEASVGKWEFAHGLIHGPTVLGPFKHYSKRMVFRMMDEYLVQPENAKGRWWGPVETPMDAAREAKE